VFRHLPRRQSQRPGCLRAQTLTLACLCLVAAYALAPQTNARQARPAASPAPPQAAQQKTIKLNRIVFEGLSRIGREQVLAQSGLEEGQAYTPEFIDEAAGRLAGSGLFRRLAYSVSGRTDGATLTFKVEEESSSSSLLPVVFDNFAWFTDEELAEAVRRRLPGFDGRVPETGTAAREIVRALEELLRARNIEAGAVEYNLSTDASGRNPELVFAVAGTQLRVCRLSFPGARTLTEEFLAKKAGDLLINAYSRKYAEGFVTGTLLPLYHERGLLRAGFLPPRARPLRGEDCENGVSVTIPVEEGSIYVWEKAEWTGNQTLTTKELDAALGMKTREVANGLKLDAGLAAIRKAYGRKGRLTASVRAVPEFDDENRRVAYRIEVTEGPEYRMGQLYINGLSEQDANNLRGRWRLLHGETFDDNYLNVFVKESLPEFAKYLSTEGRPLKNTKLSSNIKADREKQTVDVTLNFEPQGAK
jgi:outer membrane protein assembly factor BamA